MGIRSIQEPVAVLVVVEPGLLGESGGIASADVLEGDAAPYHGFLGVRHHEGASEGHCLGAVGGDDGVGRISQLHLGLGLTLIRHLVLVTVGRCPGGNVASVGNAVLVTVLSGELAVVGDTVCVAVLAGSCGYIHRVGNAVSIAVIALQRERKEPAEGEVVSLLLRNPGAIPVLEEHLDTEGLSRASLEPQGL